MRSLPIFAILFFFCLATTTSAHSPFDTFHNLTGCKHGESRTGLSSVKRYMSTYGYLGKSEKYDDDFDDGFEFALLKYQKFFHLKPTGVLDAATVEEMTTPRCGVADYGDTNTTFSHGRNLYSYPTGKPNWPVGRRNLRYYFYSDGTTISSAVLRAVYARAFSRWQRVTLVTFTEVSSVFRADIVIQFGQGDHGDGFPFDGQFGTLAHAFFPTDGRMHFDGAEFWTAAQGNRASPDLYQYTSAFDLETVAVHEIGHILGLGHSDVANAVMYPTIASQTRKVVLSSDDINGVRGLYGTRF